MAGRHEPKDVIKDILFFIFAVVGSYGYILLMLLIFSFMFVAVFPLQFEHMLIISGVGSVLVALYYIVKMIKKYSH